MERSGKQVDATLYKSIRLHRLAKQTHTATVLCTQFYHNFFDYQSDRPCDFERMRVREKETSPPLVKPRQAVRGAFRRGHIVPAAVRQFAINLKH